MEETGVPERKPPMRNFSSNVQLGNFICQEVKQLACVEVTVCLFPDVILFRSNSQVLYPDLQKSEYDPGQLGP